MRARDKEDVKQVALRSMAYDRDTGVLTWLTRPESDFKSKRASSIWHSNFCGKTVGSISVHGYRETKVSWHTVKCHRLAWLLATGDWPDGDIDHINGDRQDNRFVNLRVVSRAENCRNKRMPDDNASGVVGVRWHKKLNAWVAQIKVAQKSKHLGVFKDKADAVAARLAANKEYGFHENHGRA